LEQPNRKTFPGKNGGRRKGEALTAKRRERTSRSNVNHWRGNRENLTQESQGAYFQTKKTYLCQRWNPVNQKPILKKRRLSHYGETMRRGLPNTII